MFALLFSCYGDFSLLSPLEFFVDPKIVDGRLFCDTFFPIFSSTNCAG